MSRKRVQRCEGPGCERRDWPLYIVLGGLAPLFLCEACKERRDGALALAHQPSPLRLSGGTRMIACWFATLLLCPLAVASQAQAARSQEEAAPIYEQGPIPPSIQYREALVRNLRPVDPAVYVLGAGDVLTVALWGRYSEIRVETVSADGKVMLPVIGELRLAGLTIVQAEALLKRAVGQYYKGVQSGLALQSLRAEERKGKP